MKKIVKLNFERFFFSLGHLGTDNRLYVVDTHRVMPPCFPKRESAFLYYLFRSEFVKEYPKPLCSDG
jgi:hypothetical protein